ncbi:hypothetical protein T492DRAFT_861986 [Pavlovales sp. CCMP2436]|nr:hypothetical protein T492DRAFT_861986 [Pavlovales sp. CCMP2436]
MTKPLGKTLFIRHRHTLLGITRLTSCGSRRLCGEPTACHSHAQIAYWRLPMFTQMLTTSTRGRGRAGAATVGALVFARDLCGERLFSAANRRAGPASREEPGAHPTSAASTGERDTHPASATISGAR